MKHKSDVLVLTQARLSSTRVPRKMVRPFAGTTLMDILLDKLSRSEVIPQEHIYLSAHDEELTELASEYGVNLFHRSKESAEENRDARVIHEWINHLDYKYVILVSACNPLLHLSTIENFYLNFLSSDKNGSFAVFPRKQYFWDKDFNMIPNYDPNDKIFDTKKVDTIYEAGHCLYASKVDFLRNGYFMDDKFPPDLEYWIVDELECFDIDWPWQFEVGEILYKRFG